MSSRQIDLPGAHTPRDRGRICFLLPVHNEAETIDALATAMAPVIATLAERHVVDLLFVDDGSTDGSLARLHSVRLPGASVTVVELARNYGHQLAVTAGLDAAVDADAVIVMDSDLQDPPEVALALVEQWRAGYDVVHAQRRSRQDTPFKKLTAAAFYRVMCSASQGRIPRDTGDFKLLDRRVVAQVRRHREADRFLRGIVATAGYRQTTVAFDRHERYAGTSGYPLRTMVRLASDGLFSFSRWPVTLLYLLAASVTIAFLLSAGRSTLLTVTRHPGSHSWMLTTVLAAAAAQSLALAVIGSYAGRILRQVLNRPLYAVATARREVNNVLEASA